MINFHNYQASSEITRYYRLSSINRSAILCRNIYIYIIHYAADIHNYKILEFINCKINDAICGKDIVQIFMSN